jgi:hypothetical protein
MHPYLSRLGVRSEVQEFFAPFYASNPAGDLVFIQDSYREHFGFAFHRVAAENSLWLAGQDNLALVRRVLVCASAMDAIAFLHFYWHVFPQPDSLCFIAAGYRPVAMQLSWIRQNCFGKKLELLFPNDLLGGITDLKIASTFRRLPVSVFLSEKERLKVCFRAKEYVFEQETFSLNAFERASNYRFKVITRKPKYGVSFYETLKAGAFPTT